MHWNKKKASNRQARDITKIGRPLHHHQQTVSGFLAHVKLIKYDIHDKYGGIDTITNWSSAKLIKIYLTRGSLGDSYRLSRF